MDHEEVQEHETEVVADADADLVLRTRSGDTDAFAELWRRHYRAGITVARNMTSSLDADDLVQEAYTRIYQSIVHGGGPTGSFRAYLFTSIRNTAAAWGRARRETAYAELDGVEDPSGAEHESEAALDRGLTHQAFHSLPTRWQEVLWYSEIERMKPAEIAPLLGMKPTAVAQLTFRAREGLREAWIQAHLRSVADGSDCQWTIERLGAYARLNLGRRDHTKLERHLAGCVRCSIVASEAKEVSSRLALVLLPLALGAVGTAGYLATVQGGGTTLVALASMPSSVVHGAVTIAPGGVVGASVSAGAAVTSASVGSAGAVGAAGATTAVASAAVFGTSAVAGIGAASGLAAAGLVVVSGVVAAAVMLPATATPEPAPNPTPTNEIAADDAVTPALLPDETGDTAFPLPGESGPGPADIPLVSEPVVAGGDAQAGGTAEAGSGPTGDGTAQGENAQGDDGSPTADTGNGTTANNGNGNGTTGNNGNPTSNNGNPTSNNGNGTTAKNGDATPTNGTGNGNGGNTGNGGSTGNGTPTNGTGNGNGGNTGNGGSTGNGTPTNGTGNGNGGNTG
ncbi:sigma-70 family RNA polymerase sigma factor, partial [Microbacterium sp. NPDC056044]|uniref:sigma-70 family RNA polymerase sigma factor n=1 Tax=Microbacterium sp. NPDC056044 TaxID=3345690 RepID=UPI0035DFDC05